MTTGVLPWKSLTEEETVKYRQWARDHYKPMEPINGVWHPVVQAECVLMNKGPDADEIDPTGYGAAFRRLRRG